MKVSEAIRTRKSIRNFLDSPVEDDIIRNLLSLASRAPSGGNLQPWRIYVVNGEARHRFVRLIAGRTDQEPPEYSVYPPNLKEPYRSVRYKLAEDMYGLLGIPRDDKPARLAHLTRNFRFFDAPAAMFCFVDRIMGPPQWSDLGMFLQSFMLLAKEVGLDTCAQEAWANWPATVAEFVGAPPELMLFCGVAIGYANPDAPVNSLIADRDPLDSWATFID